MSTIYWIQRLDSIIGLIAFVIVLCVIAIIISIVALNIIGEDDEWCFDNGKEKRALAKRSLKISVPTLIISVIAVTFIPNTKDMYDIYGIGGTIDYIKQNDKAKQLPDKVVNALDAWLDKQTQEDVKDK